MANYKSATPIDIVSLKGGNYDGETTYSDKRKCVVALTVLDDGNTWLERHGVRYKNTTGLTYSGKRILALDDVEKIPSPTPEPEPVINYYFDNYIVPQTLFCWASGYHIAKSNDTGGAYSRMSGRLYGKTSGGTAMVIGSGIVSPLVTYKTTYYPEVQEIKVEQTFDYETSTQLEIHVREIIGYDEENQPMYRQSFINDTGINDRAVTPEEALTIYEQMQQSYTYENNPQYDFYTEEKEKEVPTEIKQEIETITHETYYQDYLEYMYAEGIVPYIIDINGNNLGGGRTLFGFGNLIIIDFGGQNCRNKYFSFIVGSNESMVQTYANRGTDPSSPEASAFGWGRAVYSTYLDGTIEGNPMYGINFLYLKTINYSSESGETYSEPIEIPPYVSVDSVWAGIRGFEVIFKDTSLTNNVYGERLGKEVFVLGRNIDTDVWNTTGHGIVVVCRNFRMQ
jgi:hypothetical protein